MKKPHDAKKQNESNMIFERRAYLLKPGYVSKFWAAQQQWNGVEVFGPILAKNLFYASGSSRKGTVIVHLYRFDDLNQWRNVYGDFYGRQSPDYFALVRPWMLEQENAFFQWPRSSGLQGFPRTPNRAPEIRKRDAVHATIVETTIDLPPGGLPAFVALSEQEGATSAGVDPCWYMGTLFSLIGRQHRIIHYHICPSRAVGRSTAAATANSLARHRPAQGAIRHRHLLLTPCPIMSRRRAVEQVIASN